MNEIADSLLQNTKLACKRTWFSLSFKHERVGSTGHVESYFLID